GETSSGTPPGWQLVLYSLIGVIAVIGGLWGYGSRNFPWGILLAIPLMIRALMLRPFQHDLNSLALTLSAYADSLFVFGLAIGIALGRWRRRSRNRPAPQAP